MVFDPCYTADFIQSGVYAYYTRYTSQVAEAGTPSSQPETRELELPFKVHYGQVEPSCIRTCPGNQNAAHPFRMSRYFWQLALFS